jgi:ketosteroid isomerase-like protein
MDRAAIERWVQDYERLWRTPGTDGLAALFSDDAIYSTAPYEEPYRGLDSIAAFWEGARDGAGEEFSMTSEVVAVEANTAVVRVDVAYGGARAQEFRDLWVVRVGDDGRATHFEEWPFAAPGLPDQD